LIYLPYIGLAYAHFAAGRFEETVAAASLATQSNPRFTVPQILHAAALGCLDRSEDAKAAVQRLLELQHSLWTRDVEAEILPLCEELGIGFVAYSPLGRGFLTGKVGDIAALRAGDARRNMPRFQGDNLRRNLALVEELKAHAAAENCTPAQLALAWVLSRAPYIVPIPGTSHRHRLEENAAAVSLKISADTEDALLQVFAPGAASGLRYPENHLVRLGI